MMNILVTGANGFVGRHLIEKLIEKGHQVFALVRDPHKKAKINGVEWIEGDLLKPPLPSLKKKIKKLDYAYYLVHGLQSEMDQFEYFESLMAVNFIEWVRSLKPKIIYLGGLGPRNVILSPHLRSRHLSGAILGVSGLPVLELRASIILGAGSLSFEMIKALSERLPFLPQMSRLENPCTPLSQTDLLHYLTESIGRNFKGHKIIELGGEESSYGKLLQIYVEQVGIQKKFIKIPNIDDTILSTFMDLVIPEYSQVGKKLMESLVHPTVVEDQSARDFFPEISPLDSLQSMKKAIDESVTHYAPLWNKNFLEENLLKLMSKEKHRLPHQKMIKNLQKLFPSL